MVDHRADLDALDKHGLTPLDIAISYGNQDTVNNLNNEIYRLEQERIKYDRKLQLMMGNTKDKKFKNKSWLKVLDPELMRMILDQGVDFDSDDEFENESDIETEKIESEDELENDSNSDDEFENESDIETEKIESEDESHNDSDEEHISNNWHDEGYDSASTGASNDSWHQ